MSNRVVVTFWRLLALAWCVGCWVIIGKFLRSLFG